jgi:hypothetical protein
MKQADRYDRELEVLDQVYAISDLPQLGGAGFVLLKMPYRRIGGEALSAGGSS